MAALQIEGFTTDYYLVGFSENTGTDNKTRYRLNFLFNSEKTHGYSVLTVSCEKNKLEAMLGGVPVEGQVYKVYTDKFVSKEGNLITYLKDMFISYDLANESGV